jgi:hypothetical protein
MHNKTIRLYDCRGIFEQLDENDTEIVNGTVSFHILEHSISLRMRTWVFFEPLDENDVENVNGALQLCLLAGPQ